MHAASMHSLTMHGTHFQDSRMRAMYLIAILLGLFGACSRAAAHDVPQSIALLDIGESSIGLELQLPLSELGTAFNAPLGAHPDTLVRRYGARIESYVEDGLRVYDPRGRAYTMNIESLSLRHTDNPNWTSNDWLDVHAKLLAPANGSAAAFSLYDSVIMQRVISHRALIYVRRDLRNNLLGDKPVLVGVLSFGKDHIKVDGSSGSWCKGFAHLYVLGMRHIAEGTDHLLFLLTLLLPAPLIAVAKRWQAGEGAAQSVKAIVRVVTGFTLGHSLTLSLAATGLVSPPTALIEVLIAVSILVSSLHAWRPLFCGHELLIASGFGLIHGLAFAETLAGLNFDPLTLTLSLLGFNLGIESMQLLVVAATLPLMISLAGTRCYTAVRLGAAAIAALCAVGWIVERAGHRANPMKFLIDALSAPPAWVIVSVCAASTVSMLIMAVKLWERREFSRTRSSQFHHPRAAQHRWLRRSVGSPRT